MSDPEPSPVLLARVRVVMVNPSHPGNVGSAARAMKTMGLSRLVLVSPKLADVTSHRDALALASGAADVLEGARIVDSLAEALAEVQFALAFTSRRRDLSHGLAPLREAAQRAVEALAPPGAQAALVFGTEALGLSNEDVDRCQMIAMIPANPEYMSLNVSQAIQLGAYEMMMATGAFAVPVEPARPISSVGEVDRFLQHLETVAVESGFLDPNSPKRFMTRMRRLFTRSRLEPEEVAILRGLLTSFQKARHH